MPTLNLVRESSDDSRALPRLNRMASPETATERMETKLPAAIPEKTKRVGGWFDTFEEALTAYANLLFREWRD